MEPLSETTLARLLLQLVLLLLVSRGLGEVLRRMGQPPVIGELAGGILLGPTLLARWFPEAHQWLFPGSGLQHSLLQTVGFLGLLFLLLMSGMEIDTRVLRRLGRPTAFIIVADFILPFALGIWAGWLAPEEFVGANGSRVILMLFLGTGLAITALPVIAKILIDLGAIRRAVENWRFFWILLVLAVAGKVIGTLMGGALGGLRWIESLTIGIGMNARGAMELVLAVVGFSQGLISRELFSIIVLLAMTTSLMTPPLMRLCLARLPVTEEEKARMAQTSSGVTTA